MESGGARADAGSEVGCAAPTCNRWRAQPTLRGPELGQGVIQKRDAFEMGELLETTPAAGNETFLVADVCRIELAFVKGAFNDDRLEVVFDDELGEGGIAADVPLAGRVERFGIDLADDVAQVEIAVPDVLDVAATDVAQVTFFAASHGKDRRFWTLDFTRQDVALIQCIKGLRKITLPALRMPRASCFETPDGE